MTEKRTNNPWISVGLLVFSALIATLNETILNVSLITIAQDMNVTSGEVQWLITGYMLVTSVMVPVTVFLYQSIQTKKLFLGAMGIILVGSLGCLLALNFPMLLIARVIQAAGTGMMIPIMMSTTLIIAPKEKIGTAMALCVCGVTLGPAFGPSISGIITQITNWRMVFVLILVLVVIAMLTGAFALENIAPITKPRLDILSVILSTVGLIVFLYGISIMSNPFIGIICTLCGIIILTLFVSRQRKLKEPLLNFHPFTNRRYTLGVILVFIAMLINFSLNVVMPSFLQGAYGISSMVSALFLLPGVLLNAVSTNISGKILDKHGLKIMLPAGFAVFSLALLGLAQCGVSTSLVTIVIIHILIYQGLAFTMSPAQTSALATLTPDMNSHGVAIMNTSMQIAAGIGSSMLGGILAFRQANALARGMVKTESVSYGFSGAIVVTFVIGIIGVVISLVYVKKAIPERSTEEAIGME